jgi:serine/threonine-protein kinase
MDIGATPTILATDATSDQLPPVTTPRTTPRGTRGADPSDSASSSSRMGKGRFVAGTVLAGRYRIVTALGKGGMGEVYRAEDLTLQQEVALKFLPAELTNDPAALERFHQEVRIARQVSHPNVCRVFDIGAAEGVPFLTMEYVDGEDLSVLLRRIGRFPEDKGLEIARQICAGLAAAHELGLLHRDLKPANVMLDGRGRVRISDFGLASIAGEVHGADVRAGTPAYMAPEQLAGKEVTQKSDIYSLGLVLYEIFTGKRAYDAPTLAELNRVRESSAPASPSTLVKGLDPIIERVISRCLEKDPKNRPATALQVAAALPGGDPLAAALAAGETPSPQMVAAAGSKEGMSPRFVWACMGVVILGLILEFVLAPRIRFYRVIQMPRPPEVLVERAQEMLKDFGYTRNPREVATGFSLDAQYLEYVEKNDQSPTRWSRTESALNFWYRRSPTIFFARQILSSGVQGEITDTDPPDEDPGMIHIQLDPEGRLQYLNVVTQRIAAANTQPNPKPDWDKLLAAAGFDPAMCKPEELERNPKNFADSTAAWSVPMLERPEVTLHLQAGAYRGKPIYFQEVAPWTPAPGVNSGASAAQHVSIIFAIAIVLSLLLSGGVLAWQNHKRKRADMGGAWRLAAFVFGITTITWIIGANHIADPFEAYSATLAFAWASLAALFMWMIYIALEPFVRRRNPTLLISWNRLLAGKFRDPMIGRDLLVGTAVSLFLMVFGRLDNLYASWHGLPPPSMEYGAVKILIGGRTVFAQILSTLNSGIFNAFVFIFMLVILQRIVRNQWAAGALFVLIWTLKSAAQGETRFESYFLEPVGTVILVYLIVRFGLLATVVFHFMQNLLNVPFTTDTSAWYAWMGWLGVVIIAAVMIYGARTALAGQPLFGGALTAED